jgi:hypothetical protein
MVAVSTDTSIVLKKAMDAWMHYWTENAADADPNSTHTETGWTEIRNSLTAMEMLFNYIEDRKAFLQSRDFRLLDIERAFAVPIDSHRSDLFYIGRLDKVFEYQGRIYIGEHKTTTAYKKEGPFTNSFMDSFSPNSQIDGYLYAGHLIYGKRLKAVRVDAALVHKDIHDGFRWIEVERQFAQLDGWLWESRYWIEQIEANKNAMKANYDPKAAYMPAFPKNTSACTNFGGCPYLDLCKMVSNPDLREQFPDYDISQWEPFTALEFNKQKKKDQVVKPTDQLYDNTRLSAFRQCARAYYFRHERDLKPSQDRRALLFGGAWHEAMDVVWSEMART